MELHLKAIAGALRAGGVNQVLHIIGDRWSWSVLLALWTGSRRFQDFQQRLGIPKQTLSVRLKQLVGLNLVQRELYQATPARYEYRLTSTGHSLYPLTLANWAWDRKWGKSDDLPAQLRHRVCGHTFRPLFVCATCLEPVSARDVWVEMRPPPSRTRRAAPARRTPRWQGRLSDATGVGARVPVYAWLADRWSMLVVGALLLGCHRYDELQAVLGIGTNILATRLDLLGGAGIVDKHADRHDGRRYFYRLTDSGRDLFYNVIMLEQAADQLGLTHVDTVVLRHTRCDDRLTLRAVCSHCREELRPREVEFQGRAGWATSPASARGRRGTTGNAGRAAKASDRKHVTHPDP